MSLITEWRMTPQIGRRKSKRTHDFPKILCWWLVVEFFCQNWNLPCSILVPNCSMAVAWILPSPVSCGYKRGHRNPTDRTPGVSCPHLLRVSYKEILLYPKRFLEALRVTHRDSHIQACFCWPTMPALSVSTAFARHARLHSLGALAATRHSISQGW